MAHRQVDPGLHAGPADDGTCGESRGQAPADAAAVVGMTVLVVAAEVDSAEVQARLIQSMGHEVIDAADGVAAWDLLQRRDVDLVFSD